jgi:hypothetical protein
MESSRDPITLYQRPNSPAELRPVNLKAIAMPTHGEHMCPNRIAILAIQTIAQHLPKRTLLGYKLEIVIERKSVHEVSTETTDLAGAEPLFLKRNPKVVGGAFTSLSLTGCTAEGKFELKGTMAAAIAAKATTEQTLYLWKFENITLLTTLKYGPEPLSIEMRPSVILVNGGNWSSTL